MTKILLICKLIENFTW